MTKTWIIICLILINTITAIQLIRARQVIQPLSDKVFQLTMDNEKLLIQRRCP